MPEHSGRFQFTNPRIDIRGVVTGRLAEQAGSVENRTSLGIRRGKVEAPNPCKSDCTRAHRTGLERHPKVATVEAGGAKERPSRPDRDYLSMGGGVMAFAHGVVGRGDQFSAARDHGADRNFAGFCSGARKIERQSHRMWQRKGHSAGLAAVRVRRYAERVAGAAGRFSNV